MPSAIKKLSNKKVVPVIESDIFVGHEDKRFALGVFDADKILSYKPGSIEEAYLRLRANVYIDQTETLGENSRRYDGTEIDNDDERSTHFVIIENRLGRVAIFACMRVIEKTDSGILLPIEDFFPNDFTEPAPEGSVEVSRFIIRHDEYRHSQASKLNLITAGLAHTLSNDLGPIFGVIESNFEKDLASMKLPTRRLSDLKLISEYNSENIGVEIDKYGFKMRLGEKAISNMNISVGSFGYWGLNLKE